MATSLQSVILSALFLSLASSCAEPVTDEYTKFQTRVSELSLQDGTYEVLIEPSILATDAIILYSEPSHRAVVAAFDHSFSGTKTGAAMIERFTEDSEAVMKLDMQRGSLSARIISLPDQHEQYSFEIWGRSPDGGQISGIQAEQEVEQLHSFSVEELREHDANRSEDPLTERALTCCTCGGTSCGCMDCGIRPVLCDCVNCGVSCLGGIHPPTT